MEIIEEEDEVIFAADWLELPNHLTFEIMSKLICSFDYARFGAVCMKWRSLYFNEKECPKLPTQLPLLIIPTPKEDGAEEEEEEKSCSLMYMLTHGRWVYNWLRLRLYFDMHFRGSGHGWLIAVVDDKKSTNVSVELMNPFYSSDPVIPLPSLTTFPLDLKVVVGTGNLLKAVLSADPISNPNDYMVMAIYGESKLALFKPGQTTWTPVDYEEELFVDVVYYKSKFYAVQYHGSVVVCDKETRSPKVIGPPLKEGIKYSAKEVVGPPLNGIPDSKKYIVESGGDLLQVHKKVVGPPTYTSATPFMKVFKLSLDPTGNPGGGPYWVEVKDLCGQALFLGNDASLSISTSHFPQCKANCIYYTNNEIETCYFNPDYSPRDMGVYNLGNNSFEKYYPTEIGTPKWPAPIWIEPPKLPRRRCFNMN